jgi:2-dehydro-3-deoxyphosphogluconate aldolase/(4S)-4-hydroxy-2-oxoglutarate aldolase
VVAYDQIDRAIKSGAQFIAMPHTVAALVELCRDARVSPIVGALTPTEVAEAAALAVPLVTVFPADSLGGPAYVSQLTSRFPEIRIAAASGVSAENIVDYFAGGVVAVVVGSRLFTQVEVQNGRYPAIAERARGLLRLAGVG